MNLFKKLKGDKAATTDCPPDSNGSASSSAPEKKPSIYARYQASKRGEIKDEDLQKYLGRSKAEITSWAENEPGVGKNQRAGGVTVGATSGLGGMSVAEGFGGWGPGSEHKDNRGLKFPPEKKQEGAAKETVSDESE